MSGRGISRRSFLKISGIALGSATLLCGGLGYAASRGPRIEMPQFKFAGKNSSGQPILVTYATRAGSTIEVAAAIAKTLNRLGFPVDVIPARDEPSVEGYRAVIAGSAVRGGTWLPEAVEFMRASLPTIERLPVFCYTMHLNNLGNDAESRANRLASLDDVRALIEPKDAAFFPGKLDYARLSPLDRLSYGKKEEDLRDWPAIHIWASALESLL